MSESASAVEGRRGRAEAAPQDAAERGSAAAPAGGLGTSSYDGLNGVERGVSQAAVRLAHAAAQGDPLAQAHLDSLCVGIASRVAMSHPDADFLGDSSAWDTAPMDGETPATAVVVQAALGELAPTTPTAPTTWAHGEAAVVAAAAPSATLLPFVVTGVLAAGPTAAPGRA